MIIFHSIFYLTYTLARFLVILLTIFLSPLFLLYAKSQQQIPIPSLQIAISSFFCNFIAFNCRHFIFSGYNFLSVSICLFLLIFSFHIIVNLTCFLSKNPPYINLHSRLLVLIYHCFLTFFSFI